MASERQVRDYHEQGYLVLPALVPRQALASIERAALAIVDGFDLAAQRTIFSAKDRDVGRDEAFFASAEGVHCFLEEDALDVAGELRCPPRLAINKIGHAMHDLVPEFTAFCRQPCLRELLLDLGHRAPVLWQSMMIFKQPHIGGEVRWHQDATYLVTDPPAVTGLWIAIEDAHRGNGCLWVQPGGHRTPLREVYEVDWDRRQGTLRVIDDTPWPSPDEGVALEVPAGSVVVLHDHVPHRSSHNHSAQSRHAFTTHVTERGAAWSASNWLQRPRLGELPLFEGCGNAASGREGEPTGIAAEEGGR